MTQTKTYELAYLALSHLSGQEVETLRTTLREEVVTKGGQVLSEGEVHYLPLAYEIVKKVGSQNTRHQEAYFSWIKLTVDPSALEDLEATLRSMDDILRHMIILAPRDDSLTDVFSLEGEEETDESPEETAGEEEGSAPEADQPSPEDLTRLEGIGPVIAHTLTQAGILTYGILSETSVDKLKSLLEGVRGVHDPSSWPQQAALARDGEWEELEALQDKLEGGKVSGEG